MNKTRYTHEVTEDGIQYALTVGNCPEAWIACSDELNSINTLLPTKPENLRSFINAILDAVGASIGDLDFRTGRINEIDMEGEQS